MLDQVLRTIPGLMAGLGMVVPLGWVEPAVQVGPVMTFEVVGSTVGKEAVACPPVMEVALSQVIRATLESSEGAEAVLLMA